MVGQKMLTIFLPAIFLHTPLNYSDKSRPGSDAVLSLPLAWSSISAPQDEVSLECQFPTNCESAQNKVRPALMRCSSSFCNHHFVTIILFT
jgi:hypothetical protein